jgi:hypothetical protein
MKRIIAKYQFQPWSLCKRALPEMPIYHRSGFATSSMIRPIWARRSEICRIEDVSQKTRGRQGGMNRVEAAIL